MRVSARSASPPAPGCRAAHRSIITRRRSTWSRRRPRILSTKPSLTRATSSTIGSPETAIDEFLVESEAFFFAAAFDALMEIVIVTRSDKALARIVYSVFASSRRELDRISLEALVNAGYAEADAEQFIELSQYLLSGIFSVNTWLPYHVQRTATLEAWRRLTHFVLRPRRPFQLKHPTAPHETRTRHGHPY